MAIETVSDFSSDDTHWKGADALRGQVHAVERNIASCGQFTPKLPNSSVWIAV